jgi:tRNA uridine 5-carboxymethylaminomethyl modification enzyme
MSCNPAVGGVGKGHIVREIDALGGEMGLAADYAGIQFRLLNRSKGPAVRSTRSQSDMREYSTYMQRALREQDGVTAVEGEVPGITPTCTAFSILLDGNQEICASTVVLTTGTFLGGLMHTGLSSRPGGRLGDKASVALPDSLRALGLNLGRLKTGTCPRLDGSTIDFNSLDRQDGDTPPPMFSFLAGGARLPQQPCHLTFTNPDTHEIIRQNLDRSPLFCGVIKGRGPRYCPSVEDKVVRFPDRDRHQIFIEPTGLASNEYFPNGISTSLPEDVQIRIVRSIKGLEKAEIIKFGYAVEYDYIFPTQLYPTLMVKTVPGLFCAGQINGTSGYEEAAGQGLVAGVNAAAHIKKRPPLTLSREQSYIGVMIDDLVTSGTTEPYRMFTSRVERRMLLREDNADVRLTPVGREIGLVSDYRWEVYREKERNIARSISALQACRFGEGNDRVTGIEMLKRPGVSYGSLAAGKDSGLPPLSTENAYVVETAVKFEGYISREKARLEKISSMDGRILPPGMDFSKVPGLSREMIEKLNQIKPMTIGQASRIPSVTPAAISMLVVYLQANAKGKVSHETGTTI